jgi:hypothetical protein
MALGMPSCSHIFLQVEKSIDKSGCATQTVFYAVCMEGIVHAFSISKAKSPVTRYKIHCSGILNVILE